MYVNRYINRESHFIKYMINKHFLTLYRMDHRQEHRKRVLSAGNRWPRVWRQQTSMSSSRGISTWTQKWTRKPVFGQFRRRHFRSRNHWQTCGRSVCVWQRWFTCELGGLGTVGGLQCGTQWSYDRELCVHGAWGQDWRRRVQEWRMGRLYLWIYLKPEV